MALNDAVAPPTDTAIVPNTTANVPRVEIREEPSVHDAYVNAVNSGDTQEMARVANNAKGTDVQPLAETAVKIMGANDTRLSQITAPVIKQGGMDTAEGRIAAAKVFEDQANKPQWLRAIGEKLMGNPDARLFITGGTPKTVITYDDQSRQLEEVRNELGKRLSVKDVGTGQFLTNEEYQARGGGIIDREQALGRIARKSMQSFNVEAANKADSQAMDYAAASPEQRRIASENTTLNQQLMQSNLDPALKAQIASFTSRQIGDSQSVNNGFNALDQFTRSRGVGMDNQQKSAAKAAAEALGLTLGADGTITDSKNVKVDKSRLDQLQQSYSSNRNFEQNFTQTKQDAINSGLYGKMTFEQQKAFDQILLNNKILEQKTAELIAKHGTPSFLVNPASPGPFDAFSLSAGQNILAGFNAAVMEEYAAWRKKQVEDMRARGQVPQAGELENAFIRTKKYYDLQRDAEEQSWKIKKQTEGYIKASPVSQSPVGGMAPQNISTATGQNLPAAPSTKANREEELDSLAAKHRK
jgi:hypothetical protein